MRRGLSQMKKAHQDSALMQQGIFTQLFHDHHYSSAQQIKAIRLILRHHPFIMLRCRFWRRSRFYPKKAGKKIVLTEKEKAELKIHPSLEM
jgi:hypothetical protein